GGIEVEDRTGWAGADVRTDKAVQTSAKELHGEAHSRASPTGYGGVAGAIGEDATAVLRVFSGGFGRGSVRVTSAEFWPRTPVKLWLSVGWFESLPLPPPSS